MGGMRVVKELAHWWNRSWGTMARCDVWVGRLDDGQYLVRWRGGDWRDRDGRYWTPDIDAARDAVRSLIGDGSEWTRVDQQG